MKLDEKLVALRKERRLTQAKLAEALNVSRQAISRWELGESMPSTENLKYLSNLYNVPLDYLLNDAEQELIRKEPEKAKAKKKKLAVIICILIVLIVGSYSAIKAAKEKSEGGEESKVSELQESDVGNEVIGGFDLEW